MLVITRCKGERIRVRVGETEFWIVAVGQQSKIMIGFDAPRCVEIQREERIHGNQAGRFVSSRGCDVQAAEHQPESSDGSRVHRQQDGDVQAG